MRALLLAVLASGAAVFALVILARYLDAALWHRQLVAFRLRLPDGLDSASVQQWLSALAALTHAPRVALLPQPPVVIEVAATEAGITHELYLPRNLLGGLYASLRACLPGARLEPLADAPPAAMTGRVRVAAALHMAGRQRQLAVDRIELASRSLLAALQPLAAGERVVWQWTITGAGTPPPVQRTESAATGSGGLPWWLEASAPADADELRAARLKQREPMLLATGRLLVTAGTRKRAWSLFGRAWGPVRLLNVPGAELVRGAWPSRLVARWLVQRWLPLTSWPLRLNAAELAGLIALLVGEVPLPGLPAGVARQVPPAVDVPAEGTVVADSTYPGLERSLAISRADRTMHAVLLGPTGTGKSTVMINIALQDTAKGDGLAVLDPKADMAADLLARLPRNRQDDVVVVNPADTGRPVGFNVLASDDSEAGRELAVDHVLHVFREQWKDFWGPRTDAVLRASLLALANTQANDGSRFTVCELPALLTNTVFRRSLTTQPALPVAVQEFFGWFEKLSSAERTQVVGPVMNKLSALTQRTPLRLMLGQSDGLDLGAVIRDRKILVMPLSRGLIGAETASLLSSLMMASLWQAILGRVRMTAEKREPYWLFVDEAAEVVRLPLDLADMMAEARGLSCGLVLAAQHLSQLPPLVRNALLATVRSQIVFQIEPADATLLARSFAPTLTADDLRTLPPHEVALRLCVNSQTSRPMTGRTRPLPPACTDARALRQMSRDRYGQSRADIEAGLKRRQQVASRARPGQPSRFGQRPRGGTGGRS